MLYCTIFEVIFVAIPEDIRRVPRPVNTIVVDNGKDGPSRYAVRERKGIKYVRNGNPQPKNGKVIGHILNGAYIPLNSETAAEGPDMLSYGAAAFARSVSADILADLLEVYPEKDAYSVMAIATLKVIRPSITAERVGTHYRRTFVCRYYPGTALSANTICTFLQKLGQDGRKRRTFYQRRAASIIASHHIAIDGTLKQDNSTVNDLSAFSYKAKKKGCRDVSVLYAYDIEAMEPICAEVFPGNSIDAVSYASFIRDNDIRRGIIVSDKGFPPSQIGPELAKRPDLHFLTPIKRNDVRISNNSMLSFEGVLSGVGDHVVYKKCCIQGGHYLYAYRSAKKAAVEEASYLSGRERHADFRADAYEKKRSVFGVIVFESDQDLDPKTAYLCYEDRWLLELVFNRYKNDECLDRTNVQGDFSLIGSEFINFISTLITCRMLRKAREAGLLDKMPYGDLIDDLSSSWRTVDSPEEAATDDGCWVHTLGYVFDELEALGLSKAVPKPAPKKRGRPRKNPVEDKPKRPRGRPRKNLQPVDPL